MNQINRMNQLDPMNAVNRLEQAGNLELLDVNRNTISDENSYKQFLEFEQQQQQEQLSKMLLNQVATAPSLDLDDDDYLRQGEPLEEDGSTDNEELNAIDQCQLDSNYAGNQMNQINQQPTGGNMLHNMTNGLGEMYTSEVYTVIDTILEETEDDLTSPESVTAKKNLDSGGASSLKFAPATSGLAGDELASSQQTAGQPLSQASGLAVENQNVAQQNLVQQQNRAQQPIALTQPAGRIQANPISQAQTVENLIKSNDFETAQQPDLINSASISDSISAHRRLPSAGKLPSSDADLQQPAAPLPPATSAADQWNQRAYQPVPTSTTGAARFVATAVPPSISSSVCAPTTLSEQPFSRGKNPNFKIN